MSSSDPFHIDLLTGMLRQAALDGDVPVVQALLIEGADPFYLTGKTMTKLQLSGEDNADEIINLLRAAMDEQRRDFRLGLAAASPVGDFLRRDYVGATGVNTHESGFVRAVRMRCIGEAIDGLQAEGGVLTFNDLHRLEGRDGESFASLLADRGDLHRVFRMDFWRGRPEEMKNAWDALKPEEKGLGGMKPDAFSLLLSENRRETLRKKPGGPGLRI